MSEVRADPGRVVFVDAGPMRFEVATAGPEDADRLALLLHGFPESAYSWRYQIPLLADLGYRVWAPNQRGYGRTTRPSWVADYRMSELVEDVARLIDASGCRSTTLIGHDWGGAVAWAAALRRVRPIERLVVMNIPHPAAFLRGLRRPRQLLRSWYIFFFQLPALPELVLRAGGARAIGNAFRNMAIDKSRFPDEVLEVYREQARQPGALTAMIHWYRAAVRYGRKDLPEGENPPILDVPTLMIWGEADAALGKELTYGTERLVRDFTVHYLPNVSHWVQQEAPEQVNAILAEWLTRPRPQQP